MEYTDEGEVIERYSRLHAPNKEFGIHHDILRARFLASLERVVIERKFLQQGDSTNFIVYARTQGNASDIAIVNEHDRVAYARVTDTQAKDFPTAYEHACHECLDKSLRRMTNRLWSLGSTSFASGLVLLYQKAYHTSDSLAIAAATGLAALAFLGYMAQSAQVISRGIRSGLRSNEYHTKYRSRVVHDQAALERLIALD